MFKRFLIFLIFGIFLIPLQAQQNHIYISLVSFSSNLDFEVGQDVQAYTAKRSLRPFSINKYETTYDLWYKVKETAEKIGYHFANPGQGGTDGRRGAIPNDTTYSKPVTMINWYDAIVWCNALSEIKKKTPCYTYNNEVLRDSSDTAACDLSVCNWEADGYRLPSESEWEYAARRTREGFQRGDRISGQITDDPEEGLLYAWTFENAEAARNVGTAGIPFDPNSIAMSGTGNANCAGIFDMTGNVMEFCWDWFEDYNDLYPTGPNVGFERVCRGGSWSVYTPYIFAADRYSFDPNEYYDYLGFRICTSLPDTADKD